MSFHMQPAIVWAQRKDGNVLVTIRVHDCIDPYIKLNPTTLTFRGESDNKENKFDLTLELYKETIVDESKYNVKPRGIEIILKKKDTSIWWPRLAKTTKKLHYITVDWDRWIDEDDEEEKNGYDWQNQGMNFGDMGEDDDDADDGMEEAAPSAPPAEDIKPEID